MKKPFYISALVISLLPFSSEGAGRPSEHVTQLNNSQFTRHLITSEAASQPELLATRGSSGTITDPPILQPNPSDTAAPSQMSPGGRSDLIPVFPGTTTTINPATTSGFNPALPGSGQFGPAGTGAPGFTNGVPLAPPTSPASPVGPPPALPGSPPALPGSPPALPTSPPALPSTPPALPGAPPTLPGAPSPASPAAHR
jgi:hypothetical protein